MGSLSTIAESSVDLPPDSCIELYWIMSAWPRTAIDETLFELRFGQFTLSMSGIGKCDLYTEQKGGRMRVDCNLPYCPPGKAFGYGHRLAIRAGQNSFDKKCLVLTSGSRTIVSVAQSDPNLPVIERGPVVLSARDNVWLGWNLKLPSGIAIRVIGHDTAHLCIAPKEGQIRPN